MVSPSSISRIGTQPPERAKTILFYNDRCSLCTNLANKAVGYSKQRLQIVSLYSDQAAMILGDLRDLGFPKTFYTIKAKGSPKGGYRAFTALIEAVGLINALKLAVSLLYYELKALP